MDEPKTQDNPTEMTIEYTEVTLDQVIRYFVNGYKLLEGEIKNYDSFVDTAKNKVVLKLHIEKEL